MISEISIHEFKKRFLEVYGLNFIDGFHLLQSSLNVVEYGNFKLYDNYADEEIYDEIPILNNLFKDNDEVYLFTDQSYYESNVFALKSSELKEFIQNYPLDIFSNQPLFISFNYDVAFGYNLEGPELSSGIFFQLNLKNLRVLNTKKLIKNLIDVLYKYYHN